MPPLTADQSEIMVSIKLPNLGAAFPNQKKWERWMLDPKKSMITLPEV